MVQKTARFFLCVSFCSLLGFCFNRKIFLGWAFSLVAYIHTLAIQVSSSCKDTGVLLGLCWYNFHRRQTW